MRAPEVTINNYLEVYNYYRQRDPSPAVANLGHFIAGLLYHPKVEYQPGAKSRIFEQVGEVKRPVLIVPNHIYRSDVMHLPAILQREGVFRPLRTNTVIVAQSPLFQGASRLLYDRLGAIPAFRKKDTAGMGLDEDTRKALHVLAKSELASVIGSKIDKGFSTAIFSEGERNLNNEESDPRKVQPLKNGIIDMINAATDPEGLMIVTAGFAYMEDGRGDVLRPNVFIPSPLEVGDSTDGLLDRVQASLQFAVDNAYALH